ncbi:MAG: type II toxin-antitoxin system PrlF family antitoxin [Gammaproteobacteria bacterium]
MAQAQERYSGKVTPVGNSKGIRLDAAFFKAHPEFDGEVQATILAEGQVLLSAKATRKARGKKAESFDPVMASFLGFLEEQMREHPDRIRPLDARLLEEIGALVRGVASE